MNSKDKAKLVFVFISLCVLFILVITKAFYVQVINRKALLQYSHDQTFRENTVYPYRGNIYDRNGSPLAVNVRTYSLFTIPRENEDNFGVYRKLAKIVPELSYAAIKDRVHERSRYTWLARKIRLSDEQVEAIKELKGIYIDAVPQRFYPNHELLGQVLGFVGVDNSGLSGVEYLFNEQLKGKPKIIKYVRDAKGRPVKFESREMEKGAESLTLTIDKDLQYIAEKYLKTAVVDNQADLGGVGVMDVKTGEILALANYPSFDPNEPGRGSNITKLSFVSDPFEPGSIFKTLTVASALDHKVARPDTNYYCEGGQIRVGNHTISEAESHEKFEWLSLSDIIKLSSNVGTTKVAFDLTYPKLKETLVKFGIGEKTGVELPAESRGIFNSKENVTPLSLSNMSFGQGIATTAIQILSAYGAIANGGKMVKPTIVKKEDAPLEPEGKEVISKQTSKEITSMLIKAVQEGTGTNAKIPYFQIAGKTGTAQRPDKNGGYSGYVSGFVGFPVNIERPFVIFVYVDNPRGSEYYGNKVAAPVFKQIAEYLLYRDSEPPQIAENTKIPVGESFDSVQIKQASARYVNDQTVPNFIGLDKVSAKNLAHRLQVNLQERGIGVVSEQTPLPGTPIDKEIPIKLTYRPPSYE